MRLFESPYIRPEWKAAFAEYQRQVARRFSFVGAWLALLIVPAFQLVDVWADEATGRLWWDHLAWRLPPVVIAVVILFFHFTQRQGWWTRTLLLLLALSIMFMMVGLFGTHLALGTEAMHLMIKGLIMTTAAVAILATAGLRDLALIYGLPYFALALVLHRIGVGWFEGITLLMHPLMMAVVGCAMAEVYFRIRVDNFNVRQELAYHAATDALTGLPNRRAMEWQLAAEHARSQRHHRHYGVIMADIDRFKLVNDTHGHDVGDEVLRLLADRMTSAVRTEDEVGRWGGEEFMILLPDTDQEDVMVVAEKIRQRVAEEAFPTSVGELAVTISLGVAVYDGEEEYIAVVKRSDVALYQAKNNGRNRCESG